MICPNCKSEYREGVTQCADCGVQLVADTDPSVQPPADEQPIVALWSGNDPQEFALVKEELEKSGIPFTEQSSGPSVFPSIQPALEIRVAEADAEQAGKVLLATAEQVEALELPAIDDADDETDDQDDEAASGENESTLPEEWNDEDPVSEVWSGFDQELGTALIASLQENGIQSRQRIEEDKVHLVVRSAEKEKAAEIVREVVEATPPE